MEHASRYNGTIYIFIQENAQLLSQFQTQVHSAQRNNKHLVTYFLSSKIIL